jgi:hypothetical protein
VFTPINQDNHIWNNSNPTETRDLETGGGTGRIAAAWYVDHFSNPPNFSLNVNITDGNTHQFALYALDWDSGGRIETIQIADANTNAVLDTRYVSDFVNGVYYIWNISGNITVTVTTTSGLNGVVSGAFFGGSSGSSSGISVGVSPQNVGLNAGQTQQFTATVAGTLDQNVSWSILPALGNITSAGLYTAPSSVTSAQTVTVTATSMVDPTKSMQATVNLKTGAVANFLSTDTTTQGSWHGVYGADGYLVVNDSQSVPAYSSFAVQNQTNTTWAATSTDPRALQTGSNSGRIAAAWSSASTFSLNVDVTDGKLHQFALYAVDWNNQGIAETVQIVDATTNAILDTRGISSFNNGVYLIWNISGSVKINVMETAGGSAVLSGAFWGNGTLISVSVNPPTAILAAGQTEQFTATVLGTTNQEVNWSTSSASGVVLTTGLFAAPVTIASNQTVTVTAQSVTDPTKMGSATITLTTGATANFMGIDTTTQGNWRGMYGGDGYTIADDSQSIPVYAAYAATVPFNQVWASSTTDPRALESGSGTGRIASSWWMYNNHEPCFFDINFTDGNAHELALYALDWDSQGRVETIQVIDANTNAVLSTQVLSNFTNGIWLVWKAYGHIQIIMSEDGGNEGVVSGIFFGGAQPSITVGVTPQNVNLTSGETKQFTATVGGTANQNVSWSISPAGVGSISGTGLYTPPAQIATAQTVTVTATSAQDGVTASTSTINLSTPIAASFVGFDTTTQGNWYGAYGADGFSIANYLENIPSYATFAPLNQAAFTWTTDTTDPRALQTGSGATRIASAWFNASTFSFDVNLTDGNSHRVSLYALDWDSYAGVRAETVQVLDATSGTVLDSRSMTNFINGTYLVWNISGHVTITVTMTAGGNGVVSGVFFDPVKVAAPQVSVSPVSISLTSGQTQQFTAQVIGLSNKNVTWAVSNPNNPASGSISASGFYTAPASIPVSQSVTITATGSNGTTSGTATVNLVAGAVGTTKFVGMDTTTQGTWKGTYGGDGWAIANDSQSIPSYATFAVQNQGNYTWASPSADPRALQSGVNSTRIAATWYNAPGFNFDVNITDGNTHQVAVYALDWDNYGGGRAETIQIADANTGTILDSRNIASFTNGIYAIWNISGHVKINVILTGGGNAVVSGIFWGSAPVQATPTISWGAPSAITYGTALSGTQLDAVAMSGGTAVAGTYSYNPAAGAVLGAGSQTLSVTFTPTNTTLYTSASGTVALTVNQATPVITWANPAAITAGTPLGSTQLDAAANVPGTFIYTPGAGTILGAGSQPLSVAFTPSDTTDYKTATGSATIQVTNQSIPQISWATPAAITYGTALSATQLNAAASFNGSTVAGTFAYTPASGVVPGAGSQTLSVTFTPSNTALYTSASATVTLLVNQATPVITWATPAPITSGTPLSGAQLDATASVAGTFVYTPASGTVLGAGSQTLSVTFTPTDTTDYKSASGSVTLQVNQGTSNNQAGFVGTDTTTRGTWKGTYGGDGWAIPNDSQSIPSYATFAVSNQGNYTWAAVTTDPRALQSGVNSWSTATTWYSGSTFNFDVNITDGNSHQIALYALDWDNYGGGRAEMIQVLDGSTNTVLDTRNISAFTNGIYLIWNISGHVKINVTLTGGGNAVVSGLFFESTTVGVSVSPQTVALAGGQTQQFTAQVTGTTNKNVTWSLTPNTAAAGSISAGGLYTAPATVTTAMAVTVTATSVANTAKSATATVNLTPGAAVNFSGTDAATQGHWKGVYGSNGWAIANDSQSIPAFATFAVGSQANYTWAWPSTDPRALQSGGSSGQIAATWFSGTSFYFDVNISDGSTHQVALYALDWDNYAGGRAETIQIVDANSNITLDTRNISAFTNGIYLVWNISGHVHINVTNTASTQTNAVVSGIFFK